MKNFIMEKDYQEYVESEHELSLVVLEQNAMPKQIKELKDLSQGSTKVMYWLSINIHNTTISHIQDGELPREVWDESIKQYETNTKARKLQQKNEFNTVSKKNLTINEYTLKIKGIVKSLASIGVAVKDDDKVEVCLRGLTPAYNQFKTSIQT